MCFSATASFTAAAVLCVMGIFSVALIPIKAKASMSSVQRLALAGPAAFPLLFGLHQFSEGLVWTNPHNHAAIQLFAYTAYTFWPIYASVSMALVEWTTWRQHSQQTRSIRKRLLGTNVVLAFILSSLVAWCINLMPGNLKVRGINGHLQYETCQSILPHWVATVGRFVYGYTVTGSFFASSLPSSNVLALAAGASFVITLILWENEFESTWCFFAAWLSVLVIRTIKLELESYPDGAICAELCDDSDHDDGIVARKGQPAKHHRIQQQVASDDEEDDDQHRNGHHGEEEEAGTNGLIGLVPLV